MYISIHTIFEVGAKYVYDYITRSKHDDRFQGRFQIVEFMFMECEKDRDFVLGDLLIILHSLTLLLPQILQCFDFRLK